MVMEVIVVLLSAPQAPNGVDEPAVFTVLFFYLLFLFV